MPTSQRIGADDLFRALFLSLTLVLVVAAASGISPSAPLVIVLLVTGVVILGLPHGALDPLVATQLWGTRQSFTKIRFLILYAATAAICATIWIIFPNAALIGFLCVSAYHFGSDWNGRSSQWGQGAFGIVVVSISTLSKADQVEVIYTQLGSSVAHQIVIVSQVVAAFAIVVALVAAIYQSKDRISNLLELSTVMLGGLVLSPLLFFTCYFCLLHSPRHLMQTARSLGIAGVRDISRSAAPTVLATVVLAIGLWLFLPGAIFSQKILQLVFIGLAALTAPHMLLTEFSLRQNRQSLNAASSTDFQCLSRQDKP